MKIAVLAPFEERIPPKTYGGIERVVDYLVNGLINGGNDVTLFASGDSKTRTRLVPLLPRALRGWSKMTALRSREMYTYEGIGKFLSFLKEEDFDIIHSHIDWQILPFAQVIGDNLVITLHGPLYLLSDQEKAIYYRHKMLNYISISHSQRCGLPFLNYVGNVYNGIDIGEFPYSEPQGDYLVFLGRISPEKGPVEAIKIAYTTKTRLIIAAKVDSVDENFYKAEVKPLIDGKLVQYIGEVNQVEKAHLLAGAKALLAPIQWEEPFGLYFIEAMACGTPVITLARGSVSEIIEDGKTGFICHSLDEMADKIKEINQLDRLLCRQRVEERFTYQKMTTSYLEIYDKIIQKGSNN